jgi:hypothetical protein
MSKAVPSSIVLIFWPRVERVLRAILRIKPLKVDDSGIILFSLRRYRGPNRVLNDGYEIRTGDKIIELHLNNDWFRKRRGLRLKASQSPWLLLACFARDLSFLAQQVANGTFGDNVAALHGSTILHVGARRLGFQVNELPDSMWKKGARFYMAGLMQVYHLRGHKVLGVEDKTWELKEVWLSRATFLTKYGSKNL